jgi:3',5'-cyclic AMP phosphodiesterase CpdA
MASTGVPAADATPVTVLAIADIHYDHAATKVTYGDDTGTALWAVSRQKIKTLIAAHRPRFVLLLGDLVGHGATPDDRLTNLRTVFQDLRRDVGQKLPVFFLPGNNDSLGGNYHSFADKAGLTPLSADPDGNWPALNSILCDTVKANAERACLMDGGSRVKDGYYAAYPMGTASKLRLLTLNSVIFSFNFVADDGKTQAEAAAVQLDWFERQLTDADSHGESVIVAMHIPPGKDAFADRPIWSDIFPTGKPTALARFVASLRRHARSVTLMLSGHTHREELRLVSSEQGRLAVLGMSVPSITPLYANNSALKVIELEPTNYMPVASTTYYTAPDAAAWGDASYAFSADYGCTPRQSLITCLAGLPRPKIAAAMNADYTVRYAGSATDWKKVDAAIDVSP